MTNKINFQISWLNFGTDIIWGNKGFLQLTFIRDQVEVFQIPKIEEDIIG